MAKQVYALDAELKEAVQNLVRLNANSFQPRPKRGRRPRRGGDGTPGEAGASGTFVCILENEIPATLIDNESDDNQQMAEGHGTVYKILEGGELEKIGQRTIYNPFRIDLPANSAGDDVQYSCAMTLNSPDSDSANDEFTVTGMDPLYILASLNGWAPYRILHTGAGVPGQGTPVSAIQWGGVCEEVVTALSCNNNELQVTTFNFIVVACAE